MASPMKAPLLSVDNESDREENHNNYYTRSRGMLRSRPVPDSSSLYEQV